VLIGQFRVNIFLTSDFFRQQDEEIENDENDENDEKKKKERNFLVLTYFSSMLAPINIYNPL